MSARWQLRKAALDNGKLTQQLVAPSHSGASPDGAVSDSPARHGGIFGFGWFETLVFAALLFCIALRFAALGSQPLWADELFSVFWSKGGAHYVLSHAASETNPPLYYLVLGFWMRLFGDSETAVRLLSAGISAITAVVVLMMGRALFNRAAGAIAALLFALSPWHLYFAQEARAFALLNLAFAFLLWSTCVMTARLRQGFAARDVLLSLPAAGFLVSAAACAYLHYVVFMIFATLAVSVALVWWLYCAFDRAYFACFATLGVAMAGLGAPSLALAVWQRHSASVAWMSFPSATKYLGLLTGAPVWSAAPDWVLGAVILLSAGCAVVWAAIFCYGAWHYQNDCKFVLIYAMPAIGFTVLTLASISQPFLFARTALWLSLPVYLGLGAAVAAVGGLRARAATGGALILTAAMFTAGYFAYPSKEPWRALVHAYVGKMRTGDLLVLGSNTPAVAFAYYQGRGVIAQLRRWPDSPASADRLDAEVTGIPIIGDAAIAAAGQRGEKLYFLSRGCAHPQAIPRADTDLIFHCEGTAVSGWSLIDAFLRHSGLDSR